MVGTRTSHSPDELPEWLKRSYGTFIPYKVRLRFENAVTKDLPSDANAIEFSSQLRTAQTANGPFYVTAVPWGSVGGVVFSRAVFPASPLLKITSYLAQQNLACFRSNVRLW